MSSLVSCLLLGLFTLVHSDIVGPQDDDVSPKLSWLTETRMELKIGGKRRNIWLTPTTNIPGLNTPCLFNGTLEGDPDSEVAVSGCHYSKETSVSISSSVLPGITSLIIVDGITKNIDSPIMDVEAGDRLNYSTSDVIFPPPDPSESAGDYFYHYWNEWSGPLPYKVVLRTNIKYDNSLLQHFHYSHRKTKEWISRVVQLTRPMMSDYTLSIRVALEIGEISHIDETLKATEENMYHLYLKNHNVLTSYFCKDIGLSSILGITFGGEACNRRGKAVNIVELFTYVNTDLHTARTFAHELGHTIGMEHDSDPKHGGVWGRCNNPPQGLMSDGLDLPHKWSTCSDNDFKTWWRQKGHACVKPI